MKCDSTRAETRFRLSTKWTSPFKSAGASVQSTTGSRGVRISGSNAGYTMFRGSVMGTGYPLHSPVSPSLSLSWVTVCHHRSTGVYPMKCLWSSYTEPAQRPQLCFASVFYFNSQRHAQKPDLVFRAKGTSPFKSAGGVSSVDYWQPTCAHQR